MNLFIHYIRFAPRLCIYVKEKLDEYLAALVYKTCDTTFAEVNADIKAALAVTPSELE